MEFLRITGPKEDFDRVVEHYLMKYDIHLENALMELNSVQGLKPFVEVNPYKPLLSKLEPLVSRIDPEIVPSGKQMTQEEVATIISEATHEIGRAHV